MAKVSPAAGKAAPAPTLHVVAPSKPAKVHVMAKAAAKPAAPVPAAKKALPIKAAAVKAVPAKAAVAKPVPHKDVKKVPTKPAPARQARRPSEEGCPREITRQTPKEAGAGEKAAPAQEGPSRQKAPLRESVSSTWHPATKARYRLDPDFLRRLVVLESLRMRLSLTKGAWSVSTPASAGNRGSSHSVRCRLSRPISDYDLALNQQPPLKS